MTIDDVQGGKVRIGNTVYDMVEAKYNGVVVWPLTQPVVVTYRIIASWYVYSNGGDILLASGTNYAVALGRLAEYHNGVWDHDLEGQYRLNIRLESDSPFYVESNQIHSWNQRDWDNSDSRESRVFLSYDGYEIEGTHIFQELNQAGAPVISYGEREWVEGTESVSHVYPSNPLVFTSDRYYSVGDKCAAIGNGPNGENILHLSASHNKVTTMAYTQTDTYIYTYTSGYQKQIQYSDTGRDIYDNELVDDVAAGNVTISSPYSPGFIRNNLNVRIENMGTTPWPYPSSPSATYGRSVTYTATLVKDDSTTVTQEVTLYQAVNKVESRVEVISEKYPGTPVETTETKDYYATIISSKYSPTNPVSECPARGNDIDGEDILYLAAGHSARTKTLTPWSRYFWYEETWSTGEVSTTQRQFYDDGWDPDYGPWQSVVDNYTVSVTQPAAGNPFIINGTNVKITSEGTNYLPNGRSATVTITNNSDPSATNSVVLSQAANNRQTSYAYVVSVAIDYSGNMPYTQGIYGVNYISKRTPTTTYSSGDSETGAEENIYSAISLSPSGVTADAQRVSGQGTFSITVPANDNTQLARTIAVTLTAEADSSKTDTDSKTQAAAPATINATLTPWISPDNTSPYMMGAIYVQFHVTQGVLASTTIGGVVLHTITNGGSEVLTQIGTLTVTNDANPMPRLKDENGHNVIAFLPGNYAEAWFTATSTGAVDNMTYGRSSFGTPSI